MKFGDDALDLSNFIVKTQPPITVPLTPIYNLRYTIYIYNVPLFILKIVSKKEIVILPFVDYTLLLT